VSEKKPESVKATPPTLPSRPLTYRHEISIARVKRFWDGIKEGKVYATKCRKCGKLYYPPRSDCANCLASDVEWVPLSSEGVIETFTVSHLKPQGFEHYKEPYIIAIVRTPEGVKVMGWLEGVDIEKISVGLVGQRVRITTATKPDGYPAIVFKLLEEKGGK
jgi:uncharacterized OB-fold protein